MWEWFQRRVIWEANKRLNFAHCFVWLRISPIHPAWVSSPRSMYSDFSLILCFFVGPKELFLHPTENWINSSSYKVAKSSMMEQHLLCKPLVNTSTKMKRFKVIQSLIHTHSNFTYMNSLFLSNSVTLNYLKNVQVWGSCIVPLSPNAPASCAGTIFVSILFFLSASIWRFGDLWPNLYCEILRHSLLFALANAQDL